MLTRTITAGALALVLGACASPTRVAFDPALRQKLVEVQVLDVLPQDEVIVRAPAAGASLALGGGLIGAVIDSKIGESRQNELRATLEQLPCCAANASGSAEGDPLNVVIVGEPEASRLVALGEAMTPDSVIAYCLSL